MPTICKQNQTKINKKILPLASARLVAISSFCLSLIALLIAPCLAQAAEMRLIYTNDTLGQLTAQG